MIDHSYGVIPVSFEGKEPLFFLVKNKNGAFWGFPKGHAERGETPKQAAFRELKEETGLKPLRDLVLEPFTEKYLFLQERVRVDKTVAYFLVETSKDFVLDKQEILDGGWYTFEQARRRISFPESLSLLLKAQKFIGELDPSC